MDIEHHESCDYDFLEIYEISDVQVEMGKLIGRFCGVTPPDNITSSSESLKLTFKSDRMVTGRGFEVHYDVFEVDTIRVGMWGISLILLKKHNNILC